MQNETSGTMPEGRLTQSERDYQAELVDYFNNGIGTVLNKLNNFSKYVPRQSLSHFLARYELVKRVLNVQGSIIECGVYLGGGLMTFAQLSAILEPINHQRQVIGFDTFAGFTELSEQEKAISPIAESGLFKVEGDICADIQRSVALFDSNRFINHVPKVFIEKGDISETLPKYLEKNPHLVVSLLYLDMDLYEPTKVAIELLLPRMPKGAVIAFDEMNRPGWPGETRAVMETVGIGNLEIEKFSVDTYPCFAVLK